MFNEMYNFVFILTYIKYVNFSYSACTFNPFQFAPLEGNFHLFCPSPIKVSTSQKTL